MPDRSSRLPDLSLLAALDALLELRSVTRAAERLGVTQSAVSHKLKALREQLGDPLLVGSRGGLSLTTRAQAMAAPLRRALVDLEAAVRRGAEFDPLTSTRRFVVATTDYGELSQLPAFITRISVAAPHIQLALSRLAGADLTRALESGEVDLAARGPGYTPPNTVRRRMLTREGFVVLARRDHPAIRKRLTLAKFVSLGHVLIAPSGAPGGPVDRALAALGLERRVAVTVSNFVSGPAIAARSDLLCTAPVGLANVVGEPFGLRQFPVPLKLSAVSSYLYWHERVHADPGHQWLRDLLVAGTNMADNDDSGDRLH